MDGLSALTSVAFTGGGLIIENNNSLADLNGLSALTSVGSGEYSGYLAISGNNSLADLDGLSSLTSVGEYIDIYENPTLPDCEVCDLLDQMTTSPSPIDVHGNLDDSCTPVPSSCP